MDNKKYYLYILHLDKKIADHAQHYVGYTPISIDYRMNKHRTGHGARMLAHAMKIGMDFKVAHVEEFDTAEQARYREKRLKLEKNLKRHCEICNAKK